MFISELVLKERGLINKKNFTDYKLNSGKFVFKEPARRQVTVGYVGKFNDLTNLEILDIENEKTIKDQQFSKDTINIYREKLKYLNNDYWIEPDYKIITKIIDGYLSTMDKYSLLKKSFKITNKKELLDYLELTSWPVMHRFNKLGERICHDTTNDSYIMLKPMINGNFMVGLNIRLPFKSGLPIRLMVYPESNGTYTYLIKKVNSRKKSIYYLIKDIDKCLDYLETMMFENAFFTPLFRKQFGKFEKEDFSEDLFSLYKILLY